MSKPGVSRMTSVALEKLKMSGAGRAIAVLTSGGDAQGRVTLFERVSCECILALFSERQCKYGSSNTS